MTLEPPMRFCTFFTNAIAGVFPIFVPLFAGMPVARTQRYRTLFSVFISGSVLPVVVNGQMIESPVIPYSNAIPTVGSTYVPAYSQQPYAAPQTYLQPYATQRIVASTPIASAKQDWKSKVANATSNLRESSLPNPNSTKVKLENAAEQVLRFVRPESGENGEKWLSFLRWKEFQKELKEEEPDPEVFDQLERNLRQNYSGLDMQPLIQFRSSLDDYSNALKYGTDGEEFLDDLKKRIAKMEEKLGSAPEGADTERQRDIGFFVKNLFDSNQATDFAQSIRNAYSKPNARLLVSKSFVARQFARPVSQANPVNENILGTAISGSSFLSGQVVPKLIANPRQASLQMELAAQFSSDSRGLNRGVTIFSRGSAPVRVTETISLFDYGLQAANNTSIGTSLHTDVVGIQHRSRLVRRIASRKVSEQQPAANAIGESRLRERIQSQFHKQLIEQLGKSNEQLRPRDFPALQRLGISKPTRSSWSSEDYLAVLWKHQEKDQLAAPASCPIPVEQTGLTLQLHQSAIWNAIDPVLGGRIIRNYELDDFAAQVMKEVPEKLLKESKEEPWSVSLADFHPVEIEFDDEKIQFRLRTTNFQKEKQKLDQNATIAASYRIRLVDNSIQLVREGKVEIDFQGKEQRGARASALRGFLKNKLEEIFKEELLEKPLRPLDRLPPTAPKLSIASIHCDDGWMQVHLK